MNARDCILAIATANGRGGIGVVRVSGPKLGALVERLFGRALSPRVATLLDFGHDEVIDQGLALYFPAPHSYTGEDVLELQGHGGPVVLNRVVRWVLAQGLEAAPCLRLARPGEFTERAFLNDKMDLAQAEAVADLIDASSEQAARGAIRGLQGELSNAVNALVQGLIRLRSLVEATLDFPEEEIDFLEASDAKGQLNALESTLDELLARSRQGVILREGLRVVLAGEPNVGKSSLMNALAHEEVAIVTPIAGTTRDRLQQSIHIDGVPIVLIDTAGLRETEDEVERLGIERSWQSVAQADLVLHLVEPHGVGGSEIDAKLRSKLPVGAKHLLVLNKIDLLDQHQQLAAIKAAGSQQYEVLGISSKTEQGLEALRSRILEIAGWQAAGEGVVFARERHVQALLLARVHLQGANLLAKNQQLELFAEELRLAQEALNQITGNFSADDLLGVIFSTFCIGK